MIQDGNGNGQAYKPDRKAHPLTIDIDWMFVIVTFGPLAACLSILQMWRWWQRRRPRRAPFPQTLARAPGQSLLHRIDALSEHITIQTASLIMLPVVLYAGYITHLYSAGHHAAPMDVGLLALAGVTIWGYFLIITLRMIKRRRLLRLGYAGELSVGQSLNRLMLEGYRVYHDFPAEGFNIDHIVVGSRGVFAVETKTHPQPATTNRREDATVAYDGRMLHFPTGSDHAMLVQAKQQSKWLARWLSQAVGENLSVRAVIALPGWFVKRTSPEGLPVVNPRQFASLFRHIQPRALSAEVITRIVHQLEQRCGDIPEESVTHEPF